MKRNFSLIMLLIAVLLLTACNTEQKRQEQKLQQEQLKAEREKLVEEVDSLRKIALRSKWIESEARRETYLSFYDMSDLSVKELNSVKTVFTTLIQKAEESVVNYKELMNLNIDSLAPEYSLDMIDVYNIVNTIKNREGNSLRSSDGCMVSILKSKFDTNTFNVLKRTLQTHPELFKKWFDSSETMLKALKKHLGVYGAINQETKDFLNRTYPKELSSKFLSIYETNPKDFEVYLKAFLEAVNNGELKTWYPNIKLPVEYCFRDNEIMKAYQDFRDWVWLHEYAKALPTLKHMVSEVDSW